MKNRILALLFIVVIPLGLYAQIDSNTRDNLMNEGYSCFKAGDYAKAREKFKTVTNNSLSDDEAQSMYDTCQIFINTVNAALDCEKKRDFAGAIEYYQKILDRNPTDKKTQEMLESCIQSQYEPKLKLAQQLYREGKYEQAKYQLSEYTSLTGLNDNALLSDIVAALTLSNEATGALQRGDYATAKKYFDKLLEINPTDVLSAQAIAEINERVQKDYQKPSEKKYNVGDYYADNEGNYGVVFWVDESKEHGKIVSLDEVDHYIWSSRDEKTDALSNADGYYNTEMIKKLKKWEKRYPAAYWCTSHGPGWYLPARDELLQLYDALPNVNSTLRSYGKEIGNHAYWSSTDIESIMCAWAIQVIFYKPKPMIFKGDKNLQYSPHVRAIFKF